MTITKSRERLSRARVIDAALKVMDAEGLDAVSMRRVAREVGVEAMSLYNHVEDKDDLLRGICDRVMGGFEFPQETGDWVERCKAGARAWRRLLQAGSVVARFAATDRVRPGPDPRRWALRPRHRPGVPRARRVHPGIRDDGGRLDQGARG